MCGVFLIMPTRPTRKKAKASKRVPKKRGRQLGAPSPHAFAFRLDDAESMGAPCRSQMYKLAESGDLTFIKIAGRTMVTGESLRRLLGIKAEEPIVSATK
jgi:hypothetical protein